MQRIIFKKYRTLASNPVGVYKKFKAKLKAKITKLRRGIPPPHIYCEDYDEHWNFTTFKNKIVLDLGADHGSTAYYFLRKGAAKVVAVEGDPQLASKLRFNSQRFKKIVPIENFIDSSEKIEKLISDYNPDIVKVDIEGYEKLVLEVHDIGNVNEWLIEAHTNELYIALVKFFLKHGFSIRSFSHYNLTVFYAWKK